jgi:hypothetical protein
LEEILWEPDQRAYVMQDVTGALPLRGLVLPLQWGFIIAVVLILAGLSAEILAGRRWPAVVQTVAGFGAAAALTIGELLVRLPAPHFRSAVNPFQPTDSG